MTRKDYRSLAAALHDARPDLGPHDCTTDAHDNMRRRYAQWRRCVSSIADALAADSGYDLNGNRRFDRDRFYAAAGVAD